MELRNTTLDDIASVIGFTATLRLVAWFGDFGNLYVPVEAKEDHLLTKLIGLSAAKRMSENWGNKHLAIPTLRNYEVDSKRKLIARLLELGVGTREIGTHVKMSERRVQQICREMEQAGIIDPVAKVKKVGKLSREIEA